MSDRPYLELLYLAVCGVNHIAPDADRIAKMDVSAVCQKAQAHALCGLTYSAVGDLLPEGEEKERWKQAWAMAVRKELLMDQERAELCTFLEAHHIRYVLLKGIELKKLYPGSGQREMGDNDILFDGSYQGKVRDWFAERGYQVVSYGALHDDIYHKEPFYNFEMTLRLFEDHEGSPTFQAYFSSVWDRVVPISGSEYRMKMTDEDFYIYFLAHAWHHLTAYGTGLRTLIDCGIFLQKKPFLDWDYIYGILDQIGLAEFDSVLRPLSQKIMSLPFGSMELTKPEVTLLHYMDHSGTYGSWEHGIEQKLEDSQDQRAVGVCAKLRYMYRRLIPPREFYGQCREYERIYENKGQRVSFLLHRIRKALFQERKRILHELNCLWRDN